MSKPRRQLLDERQYLASEAVAAQRHEYVDGIAYAMAGADEQHNRIAGNVFVVLRSAARGTPCGVYISDMKLRVNGGRVYYYPDVMLSGEPATPDSLFKEAPCLVAEVLSSSTRAVDTRGKLLTYRGIASLRYYVLVDSERLSVSYYVRSKQGEWLSATLDAGERIDVECGPVTVSLGLSEIYEDTGLLSVA